MSESNKKTLRTITTLLVCVAIVFAFFISIIRVFGFQVYGVLTGSMEPAYPTGSLIYVRDVDADKLRIGDVITFSLSPNVIATHRIVDIVTDESNPSVRRFQTKGDANSSVDATLVEASKIIGKVAFCIPYLGDIANYIQNPPGTYVAILISGILIFLVFLTDASAGDKIKLFQKKTDAPPQPSQPVAAAPAGYPVPQQAGVPYQQTAQPPQNPYPQQPVQNAYQANQSAQPVPTMQASGYTYQKQQDNAAQSRYGIQQPMQNGYPAQQPMRNGGYPQQQYPQNGFAYRQQPANGYQQQPAPHPYPQRQQGAFMQQPSVGYRQPVQQNRMNTNQPPVGQQAAYPQQPRPQAPNGYQQSSPQGSVYQPGGYVQPQADNGAPRRRRSNTNSTTL